MKAERFIAGRIRFNGRMASVAIALSFFIMIIAVAIASGFRREIRKGVAELSGDVMLTSAAFNYYSEDNPIDAEPSYLGIMKNLPEVGSIEPAVYRAGIVKSGESIHGILLKGTQGTDTCRLGAKVPSRLASMLNLKVGDPMLCYFVSDRVKARKFTVTEIYPAILDGDDKLLVMVDIDDLRRLNGWSEHQASALEVKLKGKSVTDNDIRRVSRELGDISYKCTGEDEDVLVPSASVDRFGQLFDWLGLLDFNVAAILILMTIVAGFNMISGLLILLFRNISTIGMLKTLGMSNGGVARVFMLVSARLVVTGMLAGNALALLFCLIQDKTHLVRLDPDNYFVSAVPVGIDLPSILGADLIAAIAILLLMSLCSLFISNVDPSETVRTE